MLPNILIVDDYDINLNVLSTILESIECEIISAKNGKEALDILKKNQIDLVLLDINMPVMDGL